MRIALLIAASALVAGCSSGVNETAGRAEREPTTGTATSSNPPKTSLATPTATPSTSAPTSPPGQGAAIGDVIRWIEAGTPADAADFRTMTRDGVATPLEDEVAFTTAGTEANCVGNDDQGGALACLVRLTDPPPRPPGIETEWKANWVDFSAAGVDVGSPHGDPGPFGDGTGAQLRPGQVLAFGDHRCRADAAGLFCVDYAHQTAVKLSTGGVEAFGCLRKVAAPADIGLRFSC